MSGPGGRGGGSISKLSSDPLGSHRLTLCVIVNIAMCSDIAKLRSQIHRYIDI